MIARRRARPSLPLCGALCTLVASLLVAPLTPARAQGSEAADAPGHVLGRVCIDDDANGVCSDDEPGLAGARVFSDDGLSVISDRLGRYHLGDVGRRSLVVTPTSGSSLVRLRSIAVRSDTGALGPLAKAAAPVVVAVFPGGVARVDLPVAPPRWELAPALIVGAATGNAMRLVGRGGDVIARVPAQVPAGHRVRVEGTDAEVDAEGRLFLEVPLGERGGAVHVADRAPDGGLRVTRVRVARIARERGGDLLVLEEARWLASIDLPPEGSKVAPGKLRVPFRAQPDVEVSWLGGSSVTTSSALLVDVDARGTTPLGIGLRSRGGGVADVSLPLGLVVDPLAGARFFAFGDVRAGVPVLPSFALDGFAASGRLTSSFEVPLDGLPLLSLVGGRVEGVASLDDVWLADALAGEVHYGARAGSGWARFLEDDDVPFFADGSVTTTLNPASLPLSARWIGEAGALGIGAARTGLEGAEVGRFDRAITGPFVDVEQALGPVSLSATGGADLAVAPFVDGSFARAAHAELTGTGGVVYRLPQRDVVAGSERLWVEVSDPLTGVVKQRRALVRGRDYDVDYPSGLVMLASPVGREGSPAVGRLAAAGSAFESRIVADYLVSTFQAQEGGSFGGRVGARVLGVELGVRGAGDSDSDYWLGGVDLDAQPFPWLSLSASAADSVGDPFAGEDAFLLSRDGGASWRSPVSSDARPSGLAYAARARIGSDDDGATLWGAVREPGYRDGAYASDDGAMQVGAEGNLTLGSSRFGMFADWREGAVPKGLLDDARRAEVRTGAVRVEQPLGRLFTAAVEGHARQVGLERVASRDEGASAAAGVEMVWHAHPSIDLLASHLQGLYTTGTGPGARDLTFSSLGARFTDDDGTVEARAGIRADGSVAGNARWSRAHDDGGQSYGGFDLSPDDVFAPRGLSSVSGARQADASGTAVFVESRLVDDPLFGLSAGQALGGELGSGPLRLVAAWERSRRFLDVSDEWESVHAQLGLAQRYVSAQAFGEVRHSLDGGDEAGDDERGEVLQWFAGSSARVELIRDLSLGGRLVLGRPGPDQRALSLARLGLAFRSPSWPVLLGSYSLRQDLPGVLEEDVPLLRQHVGLASVGVYPWPFLSLLLSTRGRVSELLEDDGQTTLTTQAGVVALRAGVLLFDLVEPAVEVGARVVDGGGVEREVDFTTRLETVVVLGPVRLGAGFVLAGFTGTGIEEPTLEPPARVYAVLQGAL